MSEFNWMERILDNEKIPKWIRALFGVCLIGTASTIIAVILVLADSKPISSIEGNYTLGVFGIVCWYFIFYKLVSWSDSVKEKYDET